MAFIDDELRGDGSASWFAERGVGGSLVLEAPVLELETLFTKRLGGGSRSNEEKDPDVTLEGRSTWTLEGLDFKADF